MAAKKSAAKVEDKVVLVGGVKKVIPSPNLDHVVKLGADKK